MNFLAHAYLSFNEPEILVGNMISDFVKGKNKFDYSQGIQQGITLHRAIDAFTDLHPATKEAKEFLKPAVGAYSGAFIDVAYDYFLANDRSQFPSDTLRTAAAKTYSTLIAYEEQLPLPFRQMLPSMIKHDWLYNYSTLQGIERSFASVVYRAKYLESSIDAFTLFRTHQLPLQKCYNTFFPEVKAFAEYHLQTILKS